MHNEALLVVGLVGIFLAMSLGTLVAATAAQHSRRTERTLALIRSYQPPGRADIAAPLAATQGMKERLLQPALDAAAAFARRISPHGAADRVSRQLDYAGNPSGWTVERLLAWKTLAAAIGAGAGVLFGHGVAGLTVVFLFIGVGAGFFLPDLLLYNSGLKRQQKLQRELPDALDLLVISVEAGLGFDAALLNVAQKMHRTVLAGEFVRVLQEMQIGRTRSDAFRSLGERTTVAELASFVNSLVQADKLGIPVAAVLREQAAEMRTKRQQRAEEKAQKVPVKILFPLVFCIMPSLFIVILGPGFIQIYHTIFHH
jgi:tight adherence protein C